MTTNYHIFTDEDLERRVYMEGDALAKEVMARWLADKGECESHKRDMTVMREALRKAKPQ